MHIGTPWMFWTGLGLGLLGLTGLLWALLADWLRGRRAKHPRRRCPHCWYDMSSVPSLLCPECGRTAKHERSLARSRRRWRWAAASFLLTLVGAVGALNWPIQAVDWVTLAPSAMLVRMLDDPTVPRGDTPTGTPLQEKIRSVVLRRYAAGDLSLAQRRLLAAKQFVPGLPPVSVRTRRIWPLGAPVTVELTPKFGGVFPRDFEARATFDGAERIVAYHGGARTVTYGARSWWRERPAWGGGVQALGAPPGELEQIELEGRVLEGGEEIWRGRWVERIRVARETEGALATFASRDLDELVRTAVEESLRLSGDCTTISIVVPPDRRLLQTAVTLAVEILRDEQLMASAELSWEVDEDTLWMLESMADSPERNEYMQDSMTISTPLRGGAGALRALSSPMEGWKVRIRGTPALFERSDTMDQYWAGGMETTIALLLGADEPRARD